MSQAYDRNRLVELFGDDAATLAEIEREFLDAARSAHKEIGETEDLDTIARAAHGLKGASGMIGADAMSQVAAAIEQAAHAHDLSRVRRLDENFRHELAKIATLMSVSR